MADVPPRLLLVEGGDDEHVVRHLCRFHQERLRADDQPDMPCFAISDKRGFPNLKAAISPEIKAPGRIALGILVDADDNVDARWQAVLHQLRQAAVDPPARAAAAGTVVEGTPRVGIWLMPDNGTAGELEDFIQRLLPTGDPVWALAQRYIDQIPEAHRKFATGKILRAQIHAWLATRKEPRKMGVAIGAGDLNATSLLAGQFVDWLRRLFG